MDTIQSIEDLTDLGISHEDAVKLKRIFLTLKKWQENIVDNGKGYICRDEKTNKCFWIYKGSDRRFPTPDLENGALKRLDNFMSKYPDLEYRNRCDFKKTPFEIYKIGK